MKDNPSSFSIRYLADVPTALPTLSRWFVEEWAPYYGPAGPGNAEADLSRASNRENLPLCLVALDASSELVGTASLNTESVSTHRHLTPWVTALLVARDRRGRGIGTALVGAIEQEAKRLGYACLYIATEVMRGALERRGWREVGEAPTLRGSATVYRLDLGWPM